MRFVLYTNSLSAHQLPLAREIVKRAGADNFRYIYTGNNLQGGNQEVGSTEPWIAQEKVGSRSTAEWLENCDVLLVGGLRPIDLLERRCAKGLRTFYQSERWFKPIPLKLPIPHFFTFHSYFLLPGILRLLIPSYRKMAKRFVRLMNDDPNFITLPIGPWAKKDFSRLGVRAEKMIDWGYFVEEGKSKGEKVKSTDDSTIKVLYVGRLLKLKHIDTIIRAIAFLNKRENNSTVDLDLISRPQYTLTIVGDGPEKSHLQKLANSFVDLLSRPTFSFQPSVPIREVRAIMRSHDVLVFASDATDGWGAVVSEALSEGTPVIGTYETGASAALLPDAQLFHCGDWQELARKIATSKFTQRELPLEYSAAGAAESLMKNMWR